MAKHESNTFGWLRSYLARYAKAVVFALALGLLASACAALLMFTSGYLISATALATTTLFSVLVPVACVQLFGFGRPLARYLERIASHNWVLKLTSDLRLALYRSIQSRDGDPALARSAGEYLGLLADDVAHLQNLYLRVVFPTVIAYALALGASAIFGFFSPFFGLVMLLCLFAVVVVLPLGTLLATRAASFLSKSARTQAYADVTDDVFGATDWVLANRSHDALARHAAADDALRSSESRSRMVVRLFTLASTASMGILACVVLLWAGSEFGGSEHTVNWIAAFVLGFFPLVESFSMLPESLADYPTHAQAASRLREYVESRSDLQDFAPASANRLDGSVSLADVSYTYPESPHPALDSLTLEVPSGQSLAVLGRSGSGKSTIANLLCGVLPPQEGAIKVGGHDVRDYGYGLSRVVAYLGQQPYLFNRTLRENLTLGQCERDDAELLEIMESVGLGERIDLLPRGLDTVVGETGVGFSGGEAHRIALARVLVVDTPIVVVDEPFSALDPETEQGLLDTLLDTCAGKTLIVITHHLAGVERFDRVVFVEDGHVALDGSPSELERTSERFRSLLAFDRDGGYCKSRRG